MTETTTAPASVEQVEHNEGDEEKRTVVRTQGVKKIYKMGDIEVHALRAPPPRAHAGGIALAGRQATAHVPWLRRHQFAQCQFSRI